VIGRIGGDSDLSPRGQKYANGLSTLFREKGGTIDFPKPKLVN
jgi:hypothetical protein